MKAWKGFPKEYWMYWVASSLAGAGSNILQYLLSVIVFPKILITPFAGVAADRVSKIRVIASGGDYCDCFIVGDQETILSR